MKNLTRIYPVLLAMLVLALAGCTGQAVQTTAPATAQEVQVSPTAALATADPLEATGGAGDPTAYPPPAASGVEPPYPVPGATPTQVGEGLPPSGGARTYQIVPGESTVQYEVGETFLSDNRFNTAIGVTDVVSGEIHLDVANPQNSSLGMITVDISRFKSDSGRRDNAIRERFIQTAKFPIVTFTPTGISGLPATYTPGEEISFQVTGDVTIRETTRPLTFDVTAKLEGDTLTGTATTTFLMSDFGFGPIEIAGMLGTEDEVKITFKFVAR